MQIYILSFTWFQHRFSGRIYNGQKSAFLVAGWYICQSFECCMEIIPISYNSKDKFFSSTSSSQPWHIYYSSKQFCLLEEFSNICKLFLWKRLYWSILYIQCILGENWCGFNLRSKWLKKNWDTSCTKFTVRWIRVQSTLIMNANAYLYTQFKSANAGALLTLFFF